jgi:hypothetical protein
LNYIASFIHTLGEKMDEARYICSNDGVICPQYFSFLILADVEKAAVHGGVPTAVKIHQGG